MASEHQSLEDPAWIIAKAIVDKRGADIDGTPRVGRQTLKRAKQVVKALHDAGWRVVPR